MFNIEHVFINEHMVFVVYFITFRVNNTL